MPRCRMRCTGGISKTFAEKVLHHTLAGTLIRNICTKINLSLNLLPCI